MAQHDPQVPRGESLVGVIGAGTMGAGIAQVAVAAGHRVAVFDEVPGAAERAVSGLGARLDSLAAKGKLDDAEAAKRRLLIADGLAGFKDAVLVIEAVVEDLGVKRELFAEVEAVVGDDCLLATNTSSISVTAIGAGLKRPGRLGGMHFFNPAPLLPLVEIVSGLATDPEAADALAGYAQAWGKTTVRCSSTPGFIVNRVARPFYGEALLAYEEGVADFATIDAVLRESAGFKMGPFELVDMIGLDVNLAVSTSVWQATNFDPRYAPSWTQKEYVAAGRLGRKSGRGFYDYAEGANKPEPAYESGEPSSAGRLLPKADWLFATKDFVLPLPGGAKLARCDGRPATSFGDGRILVDLVQSFKDSRLVTLAPAADAHPDHVAEAVEFFQSEAGKQVVLVEDAAGMVATRTVARLVNEAVDAVHRNDASDDDVDLAMRLGVNYPRGPLEWGADLGFAWVLDVLDNLDEIHRDGRYRASPLLRVLAHADQLMDGPLNKRDVREAFDRLRAAATAPKKTPTDSEDPREEKA